MTESTGTTRVTINGTRKPRIFLSNKMTGVPYFNFPWFDATRDRLNALGWDAVSPADVDRANGFDAMTLPADTDWTKMPEGVDYEDVMLRDEQAEETCDAIFIGDRWEDSPGACREVGNAHILGLREFYEDVCASPDPRVMCEVNGDDVTKMSMLDFDKCSQAAMREFISETCVSTHDAEVRQAVATIQKLSGKGEKRITDPVTGGQKGSKPAMFALIPSESLWELAELYGYGAGKYEAENWRRGYSWRLSFSALMRHLWAFWRGEDRDPESGFKHLTHAAWHCMTLAWFMDNRRSHDDRPKETPA